MVNMSRLECSGCFNEALMNIGIYGSEKIPRNLRKAFRDAYEDEFYSTHEDPSGPKERIIPFSS